MKYFLVISILATLVLSNTDCNKKEGDVYKGRLEIKAICSNYTISVLEGDIDTSKIVANWTDEHTGKSYTNVFKLGQPCLFPDSIDAGEEFYFVIDTTEENCQVCMAYYPVPNKTIPIRVVNK
jgi:hypothetical protein